MTDDQPGTRCIRMDVTVAGSQAEVWGTIATGPGISAWFVPTEVDGREGGEVTQHFGPGMDAAGRVVAWEPPHRFAFSAGAGTERGLTFEWRVEPAVAGSCVVRLINHGFGDGPDWDAEYEGMRGGWALFMENLRLVRSHFPGERCSSLIVNASAAGPAPEAQARLLAELGVDAPAEGAAVAATPLGLSGRAERVTPSMLTVLLDAPAPGIAFVAAEGAGDPVFVSLYGYFFGPGAEAAVTEAQPRWRAWIKESFPAD